MTKAPQAGNSKTRLVPPLAAIEAARLSACFLRDTCDNIAQISLGGNAAGVAVYTPVGAEAFFNGLLPGSFDLLGQRGRTFGHRLFNASEDLLSSGTSHFVSSIRIAQLYLPSFCGPQLSALARPGDRVVLGPAEMVVTT